MSEVSGDKARKMIYFYKPPGFSPELQGKTEIYKEGNKAIFSYKSEFRDTGECSGFFVEVSLVDYTDGVAKLLAKGNCDLSNEKILILKKKGLSLFIQTDLCSLDIPDFDFSCLQI